MLSSHAEPLRGAEFRAWGVQALIPQLKAQILHLIMKAEIGLTSYTCKDEDDVL